MKYYELMSLLDAQRVQHGKWRMLINYKLEQLRKQFSAYLGFSEDYSLDGEQRYVELFTETGELFHITNNSTVKRVGNILVVTAVVVVAVDFDGGSLPCKCTIQARYQNGVVEFKVARGNRWVANTNVTCRSILDELKYSIEYAPFL